MKYFYFTLCFFLIQFAKIYAQNYEEDFVIFNVLDESYLPIEIINGNLKSYQSNNNSIQSVLNSHNITEIVPLLSNISEIKHPLIDNLKKVYLMKCSDCVITDLFNDMLSLNEYFPEAGLIPIPELDYTPNDYQDLTTNCSCPAIYDCFPDYLSQINALEAWDISKGSSEIRIGIVETSFNTNHEDLTSKIAYSNIDDCFTSDPTSCRHGTYVAGFAGANTDNYTGIPSIGFKCMLELYGAGDENPGATRISEYIDFICEAIFRNTKIINMSWGLCNSTNPDLGNLCNNTLQDVMKIANDFGVTMIASAGNGPFGGCPGGPTLSGSNRNGYRYPASYDEVISVSSVNGNDRYEGEESFNNNAWTGDYSHSHNDKVDIVAPGFGVLGIAHSDNNYSCHTGTSFATPIVSGLAGLLFSVNPCLSPEDVKTILRSTAVNINNITNPDGTPNYEYYNIHNAGRIDAYAAVQMAQNHIPSGFSTPSISGVTIWDNQPPMRLEGDIIIGAGDVLIIRSSTVLMKSDARIIVRRGGKLVLDDAVISNACSGQRWGGINVEGYHDIEHNNLDLVLVESDNPLPTTGYPGVVLVKNNSRIESGRNGTITTRRLDWSSSSNCYIDYGDTYYGGIIIAKNSIFRNNKKSVEFTRYAYENVSRFTNCVFETTDTYKEFYFRGVTMNRVNGIVFDGCSFDSGRDQMYCASSSGIEMYNGDNEITDFMGISSINATYEVINGCTFSNLTFGIWASNSFTSFKWLTIGSDNGAQNYFHDNCRAIWLQGITGSNYDRVYIHNNSFENNPINIFNFECTSFIENNYFTDSKVGILFFNNKGWYNKTSCNTFVNCNKGIQYIGNNRKCFFKDNTFEGSSISDIYLNHIPAQNGMPEILGELYFQNGSSRFPIMNAFTESGVPDIYTEIDDQGNFKTQHFYYYHFDPIISDRIVPDCDLNSNCVPVMNFTNRNAYDNTNDEENYGGCIDIDGLAPIPPPGGGGGPIEICRDRVCLSIIRDELQATALPLIEGSSNDLLTAVNYSPNTSTTHQAFTDASPYVSDPLLREVAINTEMEEWIKEDILIQNAPLSDSLMLVAQDEVSDYVYQVLYTIKYYDDESDREALKRYLSEKEKERVESLHYALMDANNLEDDAELVAILEEEPELTAKKQLSGYYLEKGDVTNAIQVANSFTGQDYQDLQNINVSILNEGKADYTFSSEEETILTEIAHDFTKSASHARALLEWYNGERLPLPELADYTTAGKGQTRKTYKTVPLLNNWQKGILDLSPNPARDKTNVFLPSNQFTAIAIYDIGGNVVLTMPLNDNRLMVEVPLYDLKDGIYFVVADGKNRQLQSKILVSK